MRDQVINELLDAILLAIYPALIRRSWLENFIRPIIEKYIEEK